MSTNWRLLCVAVVCVLTGCFESPNSTTTDAGSADSGTPAEIADSGTPLTGCADPANEGTSCDDGDACTQSDTCHDGACVGADPVTCTASDQCHAAGTCDPATGMCSNPAAADGSSCDDGDACTQTDSCQAGVCTGANPVTCTALDQCHVAGTCDSATGTCSNPEATDGTTCSDDDACTQVDTCQAGACVGADPVTCTALDQCHDVGTCDPTTGACTQPAIADGSACNDGNACTQTDSCQAGACVGVNPVTCTALDQCHDVGTCDPANGICSQPAKVNGSTCNDGDACTQTDACQAGACVGANPVTCTAQDQCHDAGTCNPSTGVCSQPTKANGSTCNDGDLCTQTDSCQAGACVGANPVTCTAQDQCHDVGTCDPANGVCSQPAKTNGSTCNDGDLCTQTDSCQSGVCTGGNPVTCTALDQCHDVGTCNPADGVCSQPAKANGSTCNDGDLCTQTDSCQSGACVGADPVVCTALDQCHTAGTCNSNTGACSQPTKANGTTCNDGDLCTQTDACQSGVCTGANPVTCTALDQCHDVGTCNPADGVCNQPIKANGASCNDGNACTGIDACQGGSCVGSASPNGTACNDGNACTLTDTCQNATCTGSNPVVCTAMDDCHLAGTCDPGTGVCSNPNLPNGAACDDGDVCTSATCQNGACDPGNTATVVDQQMASFDVGRMWTNGWQSFTAGACGQLVRITIFKNGLSGTQTGTLNVFEGTGTGGNLIYTGPISLPDISNTTDINFNGPMLTPGNVYTFQLDIQTTSSTCCGLGFGSLGKSTNQYPDGTTNSGGNFDWYFKTWVMP